MVGGHHLENHSFIGVVLDKCWTGLLHSRVIGLELHRVVLVLLLIFRAVSFKNGWAFIIMESLLLMFK